MMGGFGSYRAAVLGTAVLASAVAAQDIPSVAPGARGGTTRVVVAGRRYAAGGLRRFFFGPTYRRVWLTPVRVDVLDLDAYGGLKPVKKGGGKQTKSLHFESADGRRFRIRSIDKDPDLALPRELRRTVAEQIAQDQISASHPAGTLVVDGLAEAAGILHVDHKLVVIPDDPRLGDFRKEFAGVLGSLEQDVRDEGPPPPGFAPIEKVMDGEDIFYKLLDVRSLGVVDIRAYLKARLFDDVIGDWDRHEQQWDWVRFEGKSRWEPVPLDRDQAFAKFDGAAVAMVRPGAGQLVNFSKKYPSPARLNWNALILDRELLGAVEWRVWEEVVHELQAALTGPAIEQAVHRMPKEYYLVSGHPMIARLEARRDALRGAARAFYETLARDVEVHGTDGADAAEVVRNADGSVDVRLALVAEDGTVGKPYYARRLVPDETKEVRLFLKGGDDRVVARGPAPRIRMRVIGGPGDDVVEDTLADGVRYYDFQGNDHAPGVRHMDRRPFSIPYDPSDRPVRDWGHSFGFSPLLMAGADFGLFAGVQLVHVDYGFRKYPYHTRQSLGLAYATGFNGLRAEYSADVRHADSPRRSTVVLRYSETDLVHFFGFGNATSAPQRNDFYRVPVREYVFSYGEHVDLPGVEFTIGPVVKYTTTDLSTDAFFALRRPYGSGHFGQAGLATTLHMDLRNHTGAPTSGILLDAGSTFYPEVWSARQKFGETHAALSGYLTARLPLRPTLALRAGGRHLWGPYPFQEAAYLGGPDTVRGLALQRYAGDSTAWGNAELRARLGRLRALVPTDVGAFGLVDGGRVFLAGESSRRWHTGVGGGLWMSFLRPENTVTLSAVRSEGQSRIYFLGSFMF